MKAVSVDDLKPGMVLARSLVNDDMIVILSEDTKLTQAHITRLRYLNVAVVYIKDVYELSRTYRAVSSVFNRGNTFVRDYESVVNTAHEVFDKISTGNPAEVQKAQNMVSDSIAPLSKNSGAIDYLFEMSHLANDIYQHSLRVSILAGVIAKWMKLPQAERKEVMLAGFLHDIGKTRMPQHLLHKDPAKLKGEDYEAYIRHTVDGQQILGRMPGISSNVKLAVMQHHERVDGSGFPFGSQGKDIALHASIISIADLYDNITTEREGFMKRTPFDAIEYITKHLYTTLEPMVCIPVLTHIKDAFLGSQVTLNNGLSGKVAAYPQGFAARPIISVSSTEIISLDNHPELKIIEYNSK